MKNILLIYGHALSRCALKTLLRNDPGLHLAAEVASVRAAKLSMRQHAYDAVILDVSAAETNGLELFCDLKQACAELPILIVNGSEHADRMLHFMRLGCAGYLPYSADSAQLMPAIHTITRGQRYVLPQHQALLKPLLTDSRRLPHDHLSLRELQVFFKLIKGQAINAIAAELAITPGSVSVFRSKILKKMGLTNNTALIHYALQSRLVLVTAVTHHLSTATGAA
ncbi:response regulator transcription factor [Methylophilus sp.]|jgi:DNA-binding NarL/FixJ family response regulator|uniref:LuxR C-terminal-related transcriptional regulator n=1 Tax=Methylophilus sp. TaxID=29541 RepID=UPI0011D38B77|nr:response regulator transcription factor [Methylophilus sp.]TXI46477.1 MAG: response regulator transcription factor [Methylophilus sp.]